MSALTPPPSPHPPCPRSGPGFHPRRPLSPQQTAHLRSQPLTRSVTMSRHQQKQSLLRRRVPPPLGQFPERAVPCSHIWRDSLCDACSIDLVAGRQQREDRWKGHMHSKGMHMAKSLRSRQPSPGILPGFLPVSGVTRPQRTTFGGSVSAPSTAPSHNVTSGSGPNLRTLRVASFS